MTEAPPQIAPAAHQEPEPGKSIDATIDAFWQQHGAAMLDPANPDNTRLSGQLEALYHRRSGEALPEAAQPEQSLADFAEKPVSNPDEFDIGPQSRFGMNTGPIDGWDQETETQARSWMAAAGMSQSSAQIVAGAYIESQRDNFNMGRAQQIANDMIGKAYPGEADAAVSAMRRVILESGGESLRSWLNSTGMGSHPLVVAEVLRIAERKGYIGRKG